MSEGNPSGMRPEMGDSYITLPITFDYSGGRRDSQKTKRGWAIILGIVAIIITIGIFNSEDMGFISRLLLSIGFFFVATLGIRYILLDEKKVRANYKCMMENDLELDTGTIWGIYSVESSYPYICRFRNGKSGVFIGLNKDVILGKYSESEYNHYEAIGDAYNIAGGSRVQMVHIDYMDNVGTDERLEESFISLGEVKNPDLKNLLTEVFSFQQEQMMHRVTTFDVYAFLWTGSDNAAWNTIQRILACFLDANYRSYHVLNQNDLRELTKTLYNIEEFSIVKASSVAFETSGVSTIVPISLTDVDGTVTKLGKTSEEKKVEAAQKAEEQAALEREREYRKKKRKSRKKVKENEEDLVDIFDE